MRSLGLCLNITMFKVMLMCKNEAIVNTKIPALVQVGIMKEKTISTH